MNYFYNYEDKTDEEIVEMIKNGDKNAVEYLMEKYKSLVQKKSSKYFIYGADNNDVYQEGMIGLYLAIKNFNKNEQASFKTFANMCIERHLITAIKTANRQKHLILNNSISINAAVYDENKSEELSAYISFNKNESDPSEIIADNEYYKTLNQEIDKSLSKKEKDVLEEYKKGKSYNEIAKTLNCKIKSVDTAMTRIRRKANIIQEKYK